MEICSLHTNVHGSIITNRQKQKPCGYPTAEWTDKMTHIHGTGQFSSKQQRDKDIRQTLATP